jgi:hypothetical protein
MEPSNRQGAESAKQTQSIQMQHVAVKKAHEEQMP